MLRPQNGVSLTEVLVALAVLGVTLGGVTTLQFFSLRQAQSIYQRSDLIKSIQAIEMDLVKEMESLAYRPDSHFISGLSFDSAALKASFDDAHANQICFSPLGLRVSLNDITCEVKVSYYKVKEEDRLYSSDASLANSNFKSAPLSRLLYRATFFDKGVNQSRVYYFSRLKTHVLTM